MLIHELIEYAVTEFTESQCETSHNTRSEFLFSSESDMHTHTPKRGRESHAFSREDVEIHSLDGYQKDVKVVTKRKRKGIDQGIVTVAKRRKTLEEREMEREEKEEREGKGKEDSEEESERSNSMKISQEEGEERERDGKSDGVCVDGKVFPREQIRRKRLERSLRAIYVISLWMESLFHRLNCLLSQHFSWNLSHNFFFTAHTL